MNSTRRRGAAGDPPDGQAHRPAARAAPGRATTPAPSQVLTWSIDHPAALPELPLQQRGRRGDQAVDAGSTTAITRTTGVAPGSPMRGREGRRGDQTASEQHERCETTEMVLTVGAIARGSLAPAHDGQADAELVEAEHGEQGHRRDGEGAELGRARAAGPGRSRWPACRTGETTVLRKLQPKARRCATGRGRPAAAAQSRRGAAIGEPATQRGAQRVHDRVLLVRGDVREHRQRQDLGRPPARRPGSRRRRSPRCRVGRGQVERVRVVDAGADRRPRCSSASTRSRSATRTT